ISIFSLLISCLLLPGQKIKQKDLPQKYQEFLNITKYIILPQEKDVFMQLATDRERDIFIVTFWKQRDPTPGTPQNEYRDENIKRFNYANKFFRRGSPRQGWMTDMGRFHIILGPPVSIERFEGTKGIRPVQVWFYYGDQKKSLPPHFAIVFFKRGGMGEWKLYDHLVDGPHRLLEQSTFLDTTNYMELFDKIKELAPTLSFVSHSMIPGDIPFNYQPSPINNIYMASILDSPKKDVNPSYATNFLEYKGMVSTEYMTNYIESSTQVALIQDPLTGLNFMHFSIAPNSISVDYFEPKDQYFCNFSVNVSLRKEEDIIFQYTKDFPFYFSPENLDIIKGNGVAIEDSFPVIEGNYELTVLLQNSVGKEFTIFKEQIEIQEDSGVPQIGGPFFGYKFQSFQSDVHIPFKVLDRKLVVDSKKTFSSSDNVSLLFILSNVDQSLWDEGKVIILVNGLKETNPSKKSFTLQLKDYPFRRILSITHSFPAKDLSPDYYNVTLGLIDKDGKTVDEKTSNFIVSPLDVISHPIAHAKSFPLSSSFLYFYMLARQYNKVKDLEKAEANFARAYGMNPDYKKGLIEYANFLIKVKKFDKSLELIENIQEDENLKFQYYLAKGRAEMGMGHYTEAIDNFFEGNKIYNSDTNLLNSLGFCYYKTGQKEKALNVLKASLRLNPGQEGIKRLIDEIEKGRD
ncbi:MAG: GWxTD domain-containing protein, partial [Candidatus Aminicenantes bacterium]